MPFDRQHTYMTWGGRLSVASEDYWQCGIRFALAAPNLVPPLFTQAMREDAADALVAFHGNANVGICTGAKLDWVKFASLGLDGTYNEEPEIIDGIDASGGGAGTNAAGPEVALAVTLWSGSTFGRANYGRFYTPWNTLNVEAATGKIAASQLILAATAAQTLLDALFDVGATAPGAEDLVPVVMSQLDAGTTKVVTEIRVGNLKDTQRRRENRMSETYESRPVA